MNGVLISVEVNNFWLTEQSKNGGDAFEKIKSAITAEFPDATISVHGCKLEIKGIEAVHSSKARNAIKKVFLEEYNMSIAEGDYSLTAKTYLTSEKKEEALEENSKDENKKKKTKKDSNDSGKEISSSKVIEDEETLVVFPELEAFVNEFDHVIKRAKDLKINDIAWRTNVLLSMDSGHGISIVNERIGKVLRDNGYIFNSKTQKPIVEYVIPSGIEISEKYWAKMLMEIEHYYVEEKNSGKRSTITPLIFFVDLSECMGEISGKKIHDYVKSLAKNKGSFLFIFRIPYVENTALRKVADVLSDVFMLRELVIPPLSNDQIVNVLQYHLKKRNIAIEGDMLDAFEKLISFEKNDGRFSGLKTIEKLADDILYKLLLRDSKGEQLTIDKETLLDIYTSIKETDTDPEILLEQLCGMENVKQKIDEIVAQINLYKELKKTGKKLSAPTMHMRFVGNPGTGKTTVARLVAQIFKKKGILNKGYFYEIKARDLCGRYVGETAPKTSAYCRDALGSVLFIDEAYTLFHGDTHIDYGQEAIETLITEMENNRDNLVVIMAGYKKEMDDLMKSNSGLQSRMPYEIEFRNYSKDELIEIFFSMVGNNFSYTDGFDQAVRDFIYSIPDSALESEEFSNARLVRNLYERIWSKAAYRLENSQTNEILFQEDDIKSAISDEEFHQLQNSKSKKIGF